MAPSPSEEHPVDVDMAELEEYAPSLPDLERIPEARAQPAESGNPRRGLRCFC